MERKKTSILRWAFLPSIIWFILWTLVW